MISRFTCPHGDSTIWNRRRPTCESCGKGLPTDLLLNDQQRQLKEKEDRRIEKIRKDLLADTIEEERKKQARRGDGG